MSSRLNLPAWHTPDELFTILDQVTDKTLNRALYELLWQYEGEDYEQAPDAALRLLLRHPRYQPLKNLHYWLQDVLYGGTAWLSLVPEIEAVLDTLHGETCRVFGEYGGMYMDAANLIPIAERLRQHDSSNACDIVHDFLYWNEVLRQQRPDWAQWLQQRIRALSSDNPV